MAILLVLSRAIEARDPFARGHARRVTELADAVAGRLGWDDERRTLLRIGGALHDVGKLAVPEEILSKPGPLDDDERAQVERHPWAGARIVWSHRELRPVVPAVLFHHERFDGGGYPAGRAGEEIPAEARVLAVADAFDAMTSDRPYRLALPPEQALEELERCAGSQFDPEVATAFLEAWEVGAFAVTAPLRAAAG